MVRQASRKSYDCGGKPMKNLRCSIKNCDMEILARGYCKTHYLRWWRTGDPLKTAYDREMHGLRHTPEYSIWRSMRQRCSNKNHKSYQNYGGRGITVCEKWKNSFMAFYQDMGARPTDKHTIERVDNNKGYSPENVIWTSNCINCQNQRSTKLDAEKVRRIRDLYKRKLYTRKELASEFGVSKSTINRVISYIAWGNVA